MDCVQLCHFGFPFIERRILPLKRQHRQRLILKRMKICSPSLSLSRSLPHSLSLSRSHLPLSLSLSLSLILILGLIWPKIKTDLDLLSIPFSLTPSLSLSLSLSFYLSDSDFMALLALPSCSISHSLPYPPYWTQNHLTLYCQR